MTIETDIQFFNETYRTLDTEKDKLIKEVSSVFTEKLNEILPLIQYMKEHRFFFFHPDLGHETKTTIGVIVGRNFRNNREIYVYDGGRPFIYQVNTSYADEITDKSPLTFYNFLSSCDLEFAFKGIEFTKNFLTRSIKELEENNKHIKDFLSQIHKT